MGWRYGKSDANPQGADADTDRGPWWLEPPLPPGVTPGLAPLVIKGTGLSVSKLDTEQGNLVVVGEVITSLTYIGKNKSKVGLSKLFK